MSCAVWCVGLSEKLLFNIALRWGATMQTPDVTKKYLAARDALGRRHMQMLREVERGDVSAWMTCGCIVAAEAFANGLSAWDRRADGIVRPRSIAPTEGNGFAYALTRRGVTA